VEPTPAAQLHDGLTRPVYLEDPGTRALRVAMVCPYSLSRPGGVQGQVLGLARSLGARGHDVTVCAPIDRTEDAPEGVGFVDAGRSSSLRANGSVAPVCLSPAAARRALAAVRRSAPDVVHLHEPFAPGLPYALLVASHTAPMVGTFHRSGGSPLYTVLSPVTRRLARRLTIRCAVSEAAAATATSALGGRYDVLFNGIEIDRYDGVVPWPTTGRTALFLGRHEERKGLAVLLDAWRTVSTDGPSDGPARVLWVAGDGPETGRLRNLHPESPTLRWLGVLSEEEKIRRLVAADALVAPSLAGESFGLVLLEAMAARTAVVASDIDGYRQAAGGHAVLAAPGNADSVAVALSGVFDGRLALERGSRRSWLQGGVDRAADWSMTALADRYVAHYRNLVVGAGA
jgi:phosphatidyl-myo-inositol alpha-mannosyltransferase